MKLFARIAMLVMILLLAMPIFAQDEDIIPIDPDGELTETFTNADGDISVSYLAGMGVRESDYQIFMDFDLASNDSIIIATPRAIEFFDIPADTIEILSQSVYDTFANFIQESRPLEELVGEATVGDYVATTIAMEGRNGVKVVAYIFAVDAASPEFFVATLISAEFVFAVDVETAILERIIESLVINEDVSAEATPSPFIEITPEVTPEAVMSAVEFVARPAPLEAFEAVELPQSVTLRDGISTINLPESWVTDGDDMVATNEATLLLFDGAVVVPVGDVVLQFGTPKNIKSAPLPEYNLVTVIEFLQSLTETNLPVYEYTDLPFVAYYMPLESDLVPENAFFIFVKIGEEADDILIVSGISGDFDADEATILAIIGSLVYDAALDV